MNQEFNDLPWHDAELKDILIDRSRDSIKIKISWPENDDDDYVFIEFLNCYAFKADMTFGMTPPDCIFEAECILHSQELEDIKKLWSEMKIDIPELRCYRINTNSTNSTIKFFALGFRIIDV